MVEGQAGQASAATFVIRIVVFDRHPFSLTVAVLSQVTCCCTHPKGPLSPLNSPGATTGAAQAAMRIFARLQ